MFWEIQPAIQTEKYINLLKIIGSLSRLSSDQDETPFLYYRMAENIFCKAFEAENISRSDISFDVCKENYGIGLKTFLYKHGHSMEKIAEFNRAKQTIDSDIPRDMVRAIANCRNERLQATAGSCGIDISKMLYHCVVRDRGEFLICETAMHLIDIANIANIKKNKNVVTFSDGLEEYSYNQSKSTLSKRFIVDPLARIKVNIFNDPYKMLEEYFMHQEQFNSPIDNPIINRICLPLYSEKNGIHVPEKSGLNQWNAGGRGRDMDEVYIPIPSAIYRFFPDFFPARDTSFLLRLPNGSSLCVKVCQDNRKALMSNPNSALGQWILRDILKLDRGDLLTYDKLESVGIDSVEIAKFKDETYHINLKKVGTYEIFKRTDLIKE